MFVCQELPQSKNRLFQFKISTSKSQETTIQDITEEFYTLRKLAHAIYRDFQSCKKWKIFDIFLIFAQNIRREYPQCIKNRKKV